MSIRKKAVIHIDTTGNLYYHLPRTFLVTLYWVFRQNDEPDQTRPRALWLHCVRLASTPSGYVVRMLRSAHHITGNMMQAEETTK